MAVLYLLHRLAVSTTASPEHQHVELSPLHVLPVPILLLLAAACLALAACVAGLTLGLMSLDPLSLEIIMQSNDPVSAAAARRIQPVREQGNLLLVTLLFSNTLATELLPLVLEALVPGGYFSLIVSVISIMLFGEIIPQAVCSRHPLLTGSKMIGFVKVLRFVLYPLTFPIAYVLDAWLGEELGTIYNREELKGLINVHESNAVLTHDETTILKGALEFSQKKVSDICTDARYVFRLDIDSHLDRDTLLRILRSGHSRIPLYDSFPNNVVCLLLVKQLVLVNPDDELPIRSLISKKQRNHKVRVAPALECAGNTLISDLLNEFQNGRSHMAVVYDDISKPSKDRHFVGIVSIEDIIEEILQEEILDETDAFVDNTSRKHVLVRNGEGHLVRRTVGPSAILHKNKRAKTVFVKDINVPLLREPLGEAKSGEKIRPDWKMAKRVQKITTSSKSSLQPLLEDLQTDIDAVIELSPSLGPSAIPAENLGELNRKSLGPPSLTPNDGKPTGVQSGHVQMQYVRMPGYSSSSLFGEDDNIIPEDVASRDFQASSSDRTGEAVSDGTPKESRSAACRKRAMEGVHMKLRPLPEDATAERDYMPPRKRTTDAKSAGQIPQLSNRSYGSVDMGGSEGDAESI